MKKLDSRLWAARLLIAVVVAWNLECALVFLLNPAVFAPGFELSGVPGEAAVRGFGVLFVMWNIPYLVALWQPRRNRLSLWEALAMQLIGVIGESLILFIHPLRSCSTAYFPAALYYVRWRRGAFADWCSLVGNEKTPRRAVKPVNTVWEDSLVENNQEQKVGG